MAFSQTETPNPFDYGKMWTFENPPKEWFKEAYGFTPDDEWFDDVRKSSLKFASWCSASFVSPNGLIMTNHHCSRDVVSELQKEGENFDKNGYYAKTLADERKADGLTVRQLQMVKDVTTEVNTLVRSNKADLSDGEKAKAAIDDLIQKYGKMKGWEGLNIEPVTYYSGGKYSLYGYKVYDDIRLVMIPELDLGFYGGDADNFTYPRYNLDCTFWRAYDENGKPLNTSENYFKFNPEGASEGEPVFVIGNPARTERYRTVSQLEYDRDYRYPMIYKFLKNRNDKLVAEYDAIKDDPTKEYEVQALLNEIAGVANGMKAYGGIIGGLNNPDLFKRKVDMENYIRSKSKGVTYWDDLAAEYKKLEPHSWASIHLGPSPMRGKILQLLHQLYGYNEAKDNKLETLSSAMLEQVKTLLPSLKDPNEVELFKLLMKEVNEDIYPKDNTMKTILGGAKVGDYVDKLIAASKLAKSAIGPATVVDTKLLTDKSDPIVKLSNTLVPIYNEAVEAFQSSADYRKSLEAKIANQAFNVYGTDLPPDATFTLRLSDGVIKGYEYNGTIAPYKTTYYGLYNRHYSHDQEFPWALPEKWDNPPHELLETPLNTVSTNDIIGGNSGSPLINKNKEAVGLIFDGNIESLPGNFIFDEDYNRTVSVHAGGILGAIKYIYKGDRLVKELTGE